MHYATNKDALLLIKIVNRMGVIDFLNRSRKINLLFFLLIGTVLDKSQYTDSN